MQYYELGRTGISVSRLCLGSMTWGSQNDQKEADAQLDYALGQGINFVDTAEMYPTTPRKRETTGLTETIIGNWLANRKRDDVVIATKVTGEGNADIRDGARVNGAVIREALEASLIRLQSDHVDLYQLHWPNRGSYHFRKYWTYDPRDTDPGNMDQEIADILGEVGQLRQEGKLRAFGLSNETAWGTMKFLQISERHDLPRIASMQNEYSLLCRIYDLDMAEVSVNENVPLLAYSPLLASALTEKFMAGNITPGSRLSMQETLNGRLTAHSAPVVRLYGKVAERHGLEFSQMALAFCLTRPFMGSVIIGATGMDQLSSNIEAASLKLSDEIMDDIQKVYRDYPRPA